MAGVAAAAAEGMPKNSMEGIFQHFLRETLIKSAFPVWGMDAPTRATT
jgi:hypothetical protein